MKSKLIIISTDNYDWNGGWSKETTESELKELGIIEDWLEYVVNRVFDDVSIPKNIYNTIVYEDSVSKICFQLNGCNVTVIKS